MYGMVNQGIKELVISKAGMEAWSRIAEQAGWDGQDFSFVEYYPDKLTYELVGFTSKELKLKPETVLFEFGKHWIQFTAQEGYGPLMQLFGENFKACLSNLNNLHARMGMSMPHLSPPQFHLHQVDSNTYHLTYISKRMGLSAMVEGLIHGLAHKYSEEIKMKLLKQETIGEMNHTHFEIQTTEKS